MNDVAPDLGPETEDYPPHDPPATDPDRESDPNAVPPPTQLPESEPIPDDEYDETAGEDDLDIPADVETEDNPLRDPDTGEPLPADEPDDTDG